MGRYRAKMCRFMNNNKAKITSWAEYKTRKDNRYLKAYPIGRRSSTFKKIANGRSG